MNGGMEQNIVEWRDGTYIVEWRDRTYIVEWRKGNIHS